MGLALREEANRLAGQGVRPLHGNAVVPRVHDRHGLVALSAYLEGASIDKGQAAIEHHDGVTANDRAFHDFHGPAPPLALPRCHSTLLLRSGRCVPPGGRRPPAEARRLRGRTGSDILYSRKAPRRPATTSASAVTRPTCTRKASKATPPSAPPTSSADGQTPWTRRSKARPAKPQRQPHLQGKTETQTLLAEPKRHPYWLCTKPCEQESPSPLFRDKRNMSQ